MIRISPSRPRARDAVNADTVHYPSLPRRARRFASHTTRRISVPSHGSASAFASSVSIRHAIAARSSGADQLDAIMASNAGVQVTTGCIVPHAVCLLVQCRGEVNQPLTAICNPNITVGCSTDCVGHSRPVEGRPSRQAMHHPQVPPPLGPSAHGSLHGHCARAMLH